MNARHMIRLAVALVNGCARRVSTCLRIGSKLPLHAVDADRDAINQ